MPIVGSVIKRTFQVRKKIKFKRGSSLQYQTRVLKKLLRHAKDTQFGQHYAFAKILKSKNIITAFKENVPVHDYNMIYSKWWHLSQKGRKDVCWPGRIKYFALSSGTSDAATKYIPVSKDMLKSIKKASMKLIFAMLNYTIPNEIFQKGILMLGSSTALKFNGVVFEGDMSGISASNVPFWMNKFYYKPEKEILATKDWNKKLEQIAINAPNWDIGIIAGIPSWVQIMIERILEKNNIQNLHEIWPNLRIYIHGGISFEPYRKIFEKYFSKQMIYSETYMASEGFFAMKTSVDAKGLQLILNNGVFYEFVPFNEENFDRSGNLVAMPETHTIEHVQENIEYALLISTCAGAWRYLIGDTIRFVNTQTKEIIITGRTKHFLSICGEHLSVDNMTKAVQMTAEKMKIDLQEFTVQGISKDHHFSHQWYIGTGSESIDVHQLTLYLDQHLKKVNADYATERAHVLHDIHVCVIPNELFFKWLKINGKEGEQYKFPRVMKQEQFQDWEAFVDQELNHHQVHHNL